MATSKNEVDQLTRRVQTLVFRAQRIRRTMPPWSQPIKRIKAAYLYGKTLAEITRILEQSQLKP